MNIFSQYVQEAGKYKPLPREEEYELAHKARAGDKQARATLVNHNLRFVIRMARRYRGYADIAELTAVGNYGLVYAVDKYDSAYKVRFVTYACYWIRTCMLDYVLRNWSVVRLPCTSRYVTLFFKLEQARAKLLQHAEKLDCDLNAKLAEYFGVPQAAVDAISQRLHLHDVSLDAVLSDDEELTPYNLIHRSKSSSVDTPPDPEECCVAADTMRFVRACAEDLLRSLPEREAFIMHNRILCDQDGQLSLRVIGEKLGITRERARQLEVRLRSRLRARMLARATSMASACDDDDT